MHIFQTAQFNFSPAFNKKVDKFMSGMKHTVVNYMQVWGVTCEEGKYPMGFPVFGHLFLIYGSIRIRGSCVYKVLG